MSSSGLHRAAAPSVRLRGGALLTGVLSLAMAGAGVTVTGQAVAPSADPTALTTASHPAAPPPAAEVEVPSPEAEVSIEVERPSPPQVEAAEASEGVEPRGSVAAPDPTPLTSVESPLATQVREQTVAVVSPPQVAVGLASAVLPPTIPDPAAQQAAFAAEKERVAQLIEQHVSELKAEAEARAAEEARRANEWVMPLERYRLSARFGQAGSLWSSGRHTGIDLSAPTGTPLVAMQDAVVVSTGYAGAYGNRTVLRLADGRELWYAHQSRIEVQAGQVVRKGDRIGAVGATGNVTGPHLHLELHPGDGADAIDPLPVMADHGLTP